MYTNNASKTFIEKKFNQDFKKNFFVLTGYSSGIGNQIYQDLKKLGSNLILIGRNSLMKCAYNNI